MVDITKKNKKSSLSSLSSKKRTFLCVFFIIKTGVYRTDSLFGTVQSLRKLYF